MNSDYIEPNDELDTIDTANNIIETKGPNVRVGNEPVDEEEQAGASQRDPLGRNPLTSPWLQRWQAEGENVDTWSH